MTDEKPIDQLAHCNCGDEGQGQYEDEVGQIHCDYCNQPIYDVVGLLLEIKQQLNAMWEHLQGTPRLVPTKERYLPIPNPYDPDDYP